jgi:hypothetical protein
MGGRDVGKLGGFLEGFVSFFTVMTARSRIILALLSGLILGTLFSIALDFGWLLVRRYNTFTNDVAYATTADIIVWLTLAVWFFIFIKWAQGKDLSNKLKMLEIRKLEIQIHLTQQSHPEIKALPESL